MCSMLSMLAVRTRGIIDVSCIVTQVCLHPWRAVLLNIACVTNKVTRQALLAKWEVGVCIREHLAHTCCPCVSFFRVLQGMLAACKNLTFDTLRDWAFGQDAALRF